MPADKKIAAYIKPMLATAVDKPFDSNEWIFELKLDGYRAIAEIGRSKLLLYSRNGLSLTGRYPLIMQALKKITGSVVIDGEIVLLNEKGKPDFQKLQNYGEYQRYPLVYYVFDILFFNKKNVQALPLLERKKLLKKSIKTSSFIRYCDHVENSGKSFFKAVLKKDLEGIVAKKKDSVYVKGIRTKEWLKIKYQKSREAIIAGFTAPKGSRQHFGSLLLAEYRNDQLEYIGSAGTGFSDKTLKELMTKMAPLIIKRSPFNKVVSANGPITWIKPVLVCEAAYAEITTGGMLRHPVFKGLRTEKKAKSINPVNESPASVKKIVKKVN